MTFVAARRFDQRIIIIADTKITDPGGIHRPGSSTVRVHNCIPGRLKAFPLNTKISIGYAGLSSLALDSIRSLARKEAVENDLDAILKALANDSADGQVDFLVVSHLNGPEIFKIRNGNISADQESHWIGDSGIARLLQTSIDEQAVLLADAQVPEEVIFTQAWANILLTAPSLTDAVGGLPVSVLCSPLGHCFNIQAGAYNPETVVIGGDNDGLYGQYSFSFVEDGMRGAPVLGVWLAEIGIGYLYDPLSSDEPKLCRLKTIDELSKLSALRAEELGGVKIN